MDTDSEGCVGLDATASNDRAETIVAVGGVCPFLFLSSAESNTESNRENAAFLSLASFNCETSLARVYMHMSPHAILPLLVKLLSGANSSANKGCSSVRVT